MTIAFALTCYFPGFSLVCSNLASADDSETAKPKKTTELHVIGIINPDGGKSIWVVPSDSEGDKNIRVLLTKYSVKKFDRVEFYEITSWEDTGKIVLTAGEYQGEIVRRLFAEVTALKAKIRGVHSVTRAFCSDAYRRRQQAPGSGRVIWDGGPGNIGHD
jgi:hypothetical protein